MSVTLTGTGGLFTRFGKIYGAFRNINGHTGVTAPSPSSAWGASGQAIKALSTMYGDIADQYLTTNRDLIDTIWTTMSAHRSALASAKSTLVTLAANTIIEMVHADDPLPSKTLPLALERLIAQMIGNSDAVEPNTVSTSVSAGSGNDGDTAVYATAYGVDGLAQEYIHDEDIVLVDAPSGLTSTSSLSLNFVGEVQSASQLDYNWPLGSACSGSVTIGQYSDSATSANLLTNSDFATFTSDTPSKWVIATGTAGSTVKEQATGPFSQKALEIVGNGSELTAVTQTFNSSSGTTARISAKTVYAISFMVKVSAVPAAGALRVSLVDGSGVTIADDAGNGAEKNIALTGATTSFVRYQAFFIMPTTMPTTVKLRIALTTALDNAKSVYVGAMCLVPAKEAYPRGPHLAAFAGGTGSVADTWTASITSQMNQLTTTGGLIQSGFQQFFNMRSLGLQLPSDSPTIADSLVS